MIFTSPSLFLERHEAQSMQPLNPPPTLGRILLVAANVISSLNCLPSYHETIYLMLF